MTPEAIAILTGGTVSYEDPETGIQTFRSTTEHDADSGGMLWGSIRVEAGAYLAARFPDALVLVCGGGREVPPSHAQVMKEELCALGVAPERIVTEEHSTNTQEQLVLLCSLATKHSANSVLLVSNEYHIPRIKAFLEYMDVGELSIDCVSAESVVIQEDPSRATAICDIHSSAPYILRLSHEAQGIEALRAGTYSPRPHTQKREV